MIYILMAILNQFHLASGFINDLLISVVDIPIMDATTISKGFNFDMFKFDNFMNIVSNTHFCCEHLQERWSSYLCVS